MWDKKIVFLYEETTVSFFSTYVENKNGRWKSVYKQIWFPLLPPANEGYVFAGVCLSPGVSVQEGLCPRRSLARGVSVRGVRDASYWNAFLLWSFAGQLENEVNWTSKLNLNALLWVLIRRKRETRLQNSIMVSMAYFKWRGQQMFRAC